MPASGLLTLVSVLTFNLWGVPDAGFRVLSPLREERVAALCDALRAEAARPGGWDVVLLQEAWISRDRETLKRCGYAHAVDRDDASRPIDSGLLILSRHPVERSERLVFTARAEGSSGLADGEAIARKSGLAARVRLPGGRALWVFNTHLVSTYDPANDRYLETRRAQLSELVIWAAALAGADPVVLGGDLNFGPESPLWQELRRLGFTQAAGAESACTICPPNVMHSSNEGKVDHLFGSGVEARSGSTALTGLIPGYPVNYSDHFAWQTTFALEGDR